MTRPHPAATLALILTLAACAETTPDRTLEPTVADSAGVTVRTYPHAQADLPVWTVDPEPLLQIGAIDGDGPDVFGRITTVDIATDGTVTVADELAGEIRSFTADGHHLGTMGGLGEGPGEFSSSVYLQAVVGDSVFAWDGRQQRLSVFVAGEFVDSWGPSGELILARVQLRNGQLYGEATDRSGAMPATGLNRPNSRIVAISPDGTAEDLVELAGHERYLDIQRAGEQIVSVNVFQTPFARGSFFGANNRPGVGLRLVGGDNDRLVLHEWDAEGRLAAITRFPGLDRRITDEVLAGARARVEERYDEPDGRMLRELEVLESSAPDFLPAFDRVWPDDSGRWWVRRSANREAAEEWLILDGEGLAPVARIDLPDGFTLHHIRGETLAGRWQDELEVSYVRAYRLSEN